MFWAECLMLRLKMLAVLPVFSLLLPGCGEDPTSAGDNKPNSEMVAALEFVIDKVAAVHPLTREGFPTEFATAVESARKKVQAPINGVNTASSSTEANTTSVDLARPSCFA